MKRAQMGTRLIGAHCSLPTASAPADHQFKIKDNRYDPLVGIAMLALRLTLLKVERISDSLAIIALTDSGCSSHVKRVSDGIAEMRPRQAFFARGSANMLATYASLAMESHGPCFSLSGGVDSVRLALNMALQLQRSNKCEQAVLIAADYEGTSMHATVLVVDVDNQQQINAWSESHIVVEGNPSSVLRSLIEEAR